MLWCRPFCCAAKYCQGPQALAAGCGVARPVPVRNDVRTSHCRGEEHWHGASLACGQWLPKTAATVGSRGALYRARHLQGSRAPALCTQAPCTRSGPGPEPSSEDGGPIEDKSSEPRLNLISSWQQGHSADYSTAFEPSRLQGIYPGERVELPCAGPEGPTGYAPGPARSRPIVSRVTVAGMT